MTEIFMSENSDYSKTYCEYDRQTSIGQDYGRTERQKNTDTWINRQSNTVAEKQISE